MKTKLTESDYAAYALAGFTRYEADLDFSGDAVAGFIEQCAGIGDDSPLDSE